MLHLAICDDNIDELSDLMSRGEEALMKNKHSNKKRKTNIRTMAGIFILIMLSAILLSACGGGDADAGSMKDPYKAYGIIQGDGELGSSILEDPPKAIEIQPVMIQKAYHENVILTIEPMIFEKGTSKSFSFDVQLNHENEVLLSAVLGIRRNT